MRIFAAGALGSIGLKAQSVRDALRAAANNPTLRSEAEWALRRIEGSHLINGANSINKALGERSGAWGPRERVSRGVRGAKPLGVETVHTGNPPVDWDTTTGRNIVWSVELGNETFGRPVVVGDAVYVGTDNTRHMNPAYQEEAGVLVALQAKDGKFLWQDVAPRVERGLREFLLPSTTSAPYVEGNRLSYVTPPSAKLRCLDTQGFRDGENDRPCREEVFQDNAAAETSSGSWTCAAAWVSFRMKPPIAKCCPWGSADGLYLQRPE